jgi:hypothetical protein
MYLLLLIFGALLAAAGIVLAVPGVSLHEHTFDATTVTPGVVAIIGGLVLVALGLALRVLRRIELALAARPMPSADRSGEPVLPTGAGDLLGDAMRAALPSRPASRLRTTPLTVPVGRMPVDERRLDEAPDKPADRPSTAARVETTRSFAEMEFSPSPKSVVPKSLLPEANSFLPAIPSDENNAIGEARDLRASRRSNGSANARITPRFDLNARSPLVGDRSKGPAFESMWPKGPRPSRIVQEPVPGPAATPAVEAEPSTEPVLETGSSAMPDDMPVTILKSGVVDGMAYTLYSDGSIEAELPQGKLRFGSITELRNHIEQTA